MAEETQDQTPEPTGKARKVAVILHFDVWDEDGVRHPAAPMLGLNEAGNPIRKQVTHLSRAIAERMVEAGKASVPLK